MVARVIGRNAQARQLARRLRLAAVQVREAGLSCSCVSRRVCGPAKRVAPADAVERDLRIHPQREEAARGDGRCLLGRRGAVGDLEVERVHAPAHHRLVARADQGEEAGVNILQQPVGHQLPGYGCHSTSQPELGGRLAGSRWSTLSVTTSLREPSAKNGGRCSSRDDLPWDEARTYDRSPGRV